MKSKKKKKMKRKIGDYGSSNSKKFVPNSHSIGQVNTAAGMAYNQMVQNPYMTGEMSANNTIHQTYYTNYTQYLVDPNQYAAYYHSIPPHIASGMYHQPPPPPLPPDDSSTIKPPLPPGVPPSGMLTPPPPLPPQNNWNRKLNPRPPNTNHKYPRFQKNQPPPPLPAHLTAIKSIPKSITSVTCNADKPNDEITVSKKAKRKPMSTRYTRKKEWDRDDAMKALALENEYNRLQKLPMLILKFPDPELNKDIVRSFSRQIDNVHFQQPSTARYCYVTLRPDSNVREVEHEIASIPFGTGKIIVKKHNHDERTEVAPEEIDPYTLYIGNLPTNVTVAAVKEKFPTAQRIDIGFAQKMKYTRYAFIRYQTIEESIEAFRNTFNLEMESRSLIVRFRRQKGNVGLPGETRLPKAKALETAPEIPVVALDLYGPTMDEPVLDSPQTVEIENAVAPDLTLQSVTEENIIVETKTDSPQNTPPLNEIIKVPEKSSILEPVVTHIPPPPLEPIDSKANVIAEAMKLMIQRNQENVIKVADVTPAISPEPTATHAQILPDSVKIKEETILNNEIINDFIIGTRVKEEPEEYEEENEFEEDESDDEMLDDDDEDEDMIEDKEEDDDDAALYDRFNHFHDIEFADFDGKEVKPKIDELDLLAGITTNVTNEEEGQNQCAAQNRSDYDDLFDNLNPNDNLEL